MRVRKPDAGVLYWKHSSARGVEQELYLTQSSFKCDLDELSTNVRVGEVLFLSTDFLQF